MFMYNKHFNNIYTTYHIYVYVQCIINYPSAYNEAFHNIPRGFVLGVGALFVEAALLRRGDIYAQSTIIMITTIIIMMIIRMIHM